jgi:hypothetical protein
MTGRRRVSALGELAEATAVLRQPVLIANALGADEF